MKKVFFNYLTLSVACLCICSFSLINSTEKKAAGGIQETDYTFKEVSQIFSENCIECHSGEDTPNGLLLTSYSEAMNGSENGKVIIPGDPDASELVKRIKGLSKPKMPLGRDKLNEEKINIIVEWIKAGAKDADEIILSNDVIQTKKDPEIDVILFSDVRSIFNKHCIKCHMENGKMGFAPEGLILTSYNDIFRGDERIRVVPGNPAASELLRRVKGTSRPQMPFDGPPFLDDDEIKLIEAWIGQGAKDENGNEAPSVTGRKIRLQGILVEKWKLDNINLEITGSTRIDDKVKPGIKIEVRGVLGRNNEIIVERIKRD
jgi:mono/diheme cytochrome c family protein